MFDLTSCTDQCTADFKRHLQTREISKESKLSSITRFRNSPSAHLISRPKVLKHTLSVHVLFNSLFTLPNPLFFSLSSSLLALSIKYRNHGGSNPVERWRDGSPHSKCQLPPGFPAVFPPPVHLRNPPSIYHLSLPLHLPTLIPPSLIRPTAHHLGSPAIKLSKSKSILARVLSVNSY